MHIDYYTLNKIPLNLLPTKISINLFHCENKLDHMPSTDWSYDRQDGWQAIIGIYSYTKVLATMLNE